MQVPLLPLREGVNLTQEQTELSSPCPAPCGPQALLSAQPFPGRGSILAADLLLNIVCRLFFQLVGLFCLQTKPPEAEAMWSALYTGSSGAPL